MLNAQNIENVQVYRASRARNRASKPFREHTSWYVLHLFVICFLCCHLRSHTSIEPILRFKRVPDWSPRTGFKWKAKEWSMAVDVMLNQPVEVTRKDIVRLLICGDILSIQLLFSDPIARQLEISYLS